MVPSPLVYPGPHARLACHFHPGGSGRRCASVFLRERAPRRAPHSAKSVVRAYRRLVLDKRFTLPALSIGLLLSGLFASFAVAPTILMQGFGLTSVQIGLHFAAAVFVVFTAGMTAPRQAHRHGARRQQPRCRQGLLHQAQVFTGTF